MNYSISRQGFLPVFKIKINGENTGERLMKKAKIADINLEISIIDRDFLRNRLYGYENNTFLRGDMILKTAACEEIKKPKGELIKTIKSVRIAQIDKDKFCRYITDKETNQIVQATYYNNDYSDIEIQLIKSRSYFGLSLTEFEYLLTGVAFNDRLAFLGGVVLHGSSIAFENQGIIFSANSGTGKSTHTGLWSERFGDKVAIVNDDKPAIRFYDGIPFIFGTPWSGKTDLNTNVRVPLKAIVFIKRSNTNWIERLNIRDSIFNLSSQIARPYYDEEIGKKTLKAIEKLVTNVPIYRLYCNISQEAVDVVYDELIKKGRE